MCGITGYASIRNAQPALILKMMRQIRHRGPDDLGYSAYEDCAIGMSRLSIVDIEGGAQPKHTQDGALSIVFNGEVYNHRELAQQLRGDGVQLCSDSDTEVILSLYENYGAKCLDMLRGMFCFAILDRKEKSIFIARDRVGIKPLYYWCKGNKLVFGSEIKSILASNQFSATPDMSSISDYLTLRYSPARKNLFADIHKLPPGCWMKWHQGELKIERYWEAKIQNKTTNSPAEIQEEFNSLLDECIDIRRIGDVSHGAYLSGGIDSTAIVQSLVELGEKNIDTFTVGFGWAGDELVAARETAEILGTNHHEVICTPNDLETLRDIIWHSDEPLGDPIVIPTYVLAREASQRVKVVLTGEGADEILGGYLFHKAVYCADIYKKYVPDIIHNGILLPAIRMTSASLLNKAFNYPGELGEQGKQRLLTFMQLSRSSNPSHLFKYFISLFNSEDLIKLYSEQHMKLHLSGNEYHWNYDHSGSVVDGLLKMQYEDWLPDNVLLRQDKMSMAHGLEARIPFLDHKLIEFIETVPDKLKLNLFRNKILLRQKTDTSIISNVSRRKKSAFYFPMEHFFKSSQFQELLSDTLGRSQTENRGIFRFDAVKDLIRNAEKGDFLAAKQVFSLISLELWFQQFIDGQGFVD